MINFSELPEWFNRQLWIKQVMQSGLQGKYVMKINEDGWITEIKSLTIPLPVDLSITFRDVFRKAYLLSEDIEGKGKADLPAIIWQAHYEAISDRDNLHHLYHYYQFKLSDWYDFFADNFSTYTTIYHDNDAIARNTLSASEDERVVIFELSLSSGWTKPLRWDPTSWGSLGILFGGESHD